VSSFVPLELECACGERFRVSVAESLNVGRMPRYRDAIRAGTFHVFACPACGRRTHVDKLFAYSDFGRRHWYTVAPAAELARLDEYLELAESSFRLTMLERAPPMVQRAADELERRLVFGLAALREKLLAFDSGLDDRLLEVLKLQLATEVALPLDLEARIHLSEVGGDFLVIRAGRAGAGYEELEVALDRYTDLARRREAVAAAWPALFSSLVVDWRLAATRS
jgi:hypothetical protein